MFYVVPYRVLFHDTMAYGTQHFLTNLKFQCEAREDFLFGAVLDPLPPEERREFDDIAFLTRDVFSRNLGAVPVGARVAILMSIEEPTNLSVRFCFRVFGENGQPVACGFQTAVTTSRRNYVPVPAPAALRRYTNVLRERLTFGDFRSRALAGDVNAIFSDYAAEVAARALQRPDGEGTARLARSAPGEPEHRPERVEGKAFLLPGNGSLRWSGFKSILARKLDPARRRRADEVAMQAVGSAMSRLAATESEKEFRQVLQDHPGLEQIATYVESVLGCEVLADMGHTPDLIAGHSGGELSALAAAGSYSFEAGLDVVCKSNIALAPLRGVGGMIVLSAHVRRIEALIGTLAPSRLEIAIVNHAEQTTVAGRPEDIARLRKLAKSLRIAHLVLPTPYPFHCSLLRPMVGPFAQLLGDMAATAPRVPVYSPLERDFTGAARIAESISQHFARPLDYRDAILRLHELGIETFVDCSTGGSLKGIVAEVLRAKANWTVTHPFKELDRLLPSSAVAARPRTAPAERAAGPVEPIAVVGLGCVLPGARNPDELWRNVVDRVVSIIDTTEAAPLDAADFWSPGQIVPDKSYSALTGVLDRGSGTDDATTLGEAVLSAAIAQATAGVTRPEDSRTRLFIGSTADGYAEFDEGLVAAGVLDLVREKFAGSEDAQPHIKAVEEQFARPASDVASRAPSAILDRVARSSFGPRTRAIAVDAACASSLYAIRLGVDALREGRSDLAICGGVFAPGPANCCLFAQFGGLSASASRPFDAAADGAVFAPGTAVLALKRLSDALRDGDKIEAVVQECGTSSDGRGASIIEPKKDGQVLAIQRAYARSGLKPASVQYVEAHATATRVGDAIEFSALCEAFTGSEQRIGLGSIKSMIGHTGWSAGAASAVKVCMALRHATVPPQAGYASPSPEVQLERSPFDILESPAPWNHEGTTQRAGVNAFGFGGSNGHLIIDAFDPRVHRPSETTARDSKPDDEVVLVGLEIIETASGTLAFGDNQLALPQRPRILPDVANYIDRSQVLAVMAAERVLGQLGDRWQDWRNDIGVILGFEGRTANGIKATQRCYVDRVARQLGHSTPEAFTGDVAQAARERTPPSGPYSLSGLMPNLVSGRVANMLDLRGPNLVIDSGGASLADALAFAAAKVRLGEARIMLAGGVSANPLAEAELMAAQNWRRDRPVREGVVFLALTRADFAREAGLKTIASLRFGEATAAAEEVIHVGAAPAYLMGAEGLHEIAAALAQSKAGRVASVCWSLPNGETLQARFAPAVPAKAAVSQPMALHAPVDHCSIVLRPEALAASGPPANLRSGSVILVCGQPEAINLPAGPNWVVVCPKSASVPGGLQLDPADDEGTLAKHVGDRLGDVALDAVDAVILAQDCSNLPPDSLLGPDGANSTLELFIAMARLVYPSAETGRTRLLALCAGAWSDDTLHPFTGLCGGALKSIARELPKAVCRAVHTDAPLGGDAFAQLEAEAGAGTPADVETAYSQGQRHVPRLARARADTRTGPALPVEDGGVLLATGGARGITAKLVEAVLEHRRCNVVLLGRAALEDLPSDWHDAEEASLPRLERDFYVTALANDSAADIKTLRQRFSRLRDSWEAQANLKQFAKLGVAVKYIQADVTSGEQVDAALAEVKRLFGGLDMIIHGAGIQDSRLLKNKTVTEFRRVIATKVNGLRNLQNACAAHCADRPVHFHLVTSSFSFFGNDGQADYGAANEMLNRMAAWHRRKGEPWSALAWLGWAGVGMTRGAEFRPLAQRRGLRPVFPDEGKELFIRFFSQPDNPPVSVLISQGESQFYGVPVVDGTAQATDESAPARRSIQKQLSAGDYGTVDHLLNGVPIVPGGIAVDLAVRCAANGRSGAPAVDITDLEFGRYLRIPEGQSRGVEVTATPAGASGDEEFRVEVRSSFVHSSGLVLQPDILHCRCNVRFAEDDRELERHPVWPDAATEYVPIDDPYVSPRSPLTLRGPFRSLANIRLSGEFQTGEYVQGASASRAHDDSIIPWMLLDVMARLSMLGVDSGGGLPIGTAARARRVCIAAGLHHSGLAGQRIYLQATKPFSDGDLILSRRAQATGQDGRVLVTMEGLTAKRVGIVMPESHGQERNVELA